MWKKGGGVKGDGGLSLIYNPTLNHVELMPFLVRHYTFAEPCWSLWGRANCVSSLETCKSDLRFLCVCPPPPSPRGSPPQRQKVTRLPLRSCFISSQHVRTRLPGYMHPHLLYQNRVNYSACLPPRPRPLTHLPCRELPRHRWGSDKSSFVVYCHCFCQVSKLWLCGKPWGKITVRVTSL